MMHPDPINPDERQLWARFAGPPEAAAPPPRGPCPSALDLAAYLDGRLVDAARDDVEAHLVLCAECRGALREVRDGADEVRPFVAGSLIESASALIAMRPAAPRGGWVAAARWSFAAAASLAMALLAFQAGANYAVASHPQEDQVLREMSLGLLGPAPSWEPALDPLPVEEDLQ